MEHDNKTEYDLNALIQQKERSDRHLLFAEIPLVLSSTLLLFSLAFLTSFVEMPGWTKALLMIFAFLQFLASCLYAVRIEQVSGYYECGECGYRQIPTYKAVLSAAHIGRTRYLKCPHCGKRSWQKKVLN